MQPLNEGGGGNSSRSVIIIALASLIFAGAIPFIIFSGGGGGDGEFPVFIVICGGGFALISIGSAVYKYMETYYVTKPEIAITPVQVKLGEMATMSYQQMFKRDTNVKKLALQLVFRETARYRVGTDTRTVTHELVVDEFGYPGQSYPKGHMLNDTWQFIIPQNGMHTHHSTNNWLRWYVKVNVEIEGWMNFTKEYEVTVAAERLLSQ